MSGYPDHTDSPGQPARIKKESEADGPRPPPPTQFTMDGQPSKALDWPYYGRNLNLSQELDQLLAESRSLISPTSSGTAAQPGPTVSQHYTAPVSQLGQVLQQGQIPQQGQTLQQGQLSQQGESAVTATAGLDPSSLNNSNNVASKGPDAADQASGNKREGSSSLARNVPDHQPAEPDQPEEGELVPSSRAQLLGEEGDPTVREAATHESDSGHADTEADAEVAREVGKALMELNNAAQKKSYRKALDVYKQLSTGDWYGTVYIGSRSAKLREPEKTAAEAKIKLVSSGLRLLDSMQKGHPDMLNLFPRPPDSPPPGFERPPGTHFPRGTKSAAHIPPPPSGGPPRRQTNPAVHAANNNFVGLLGEWANLNPQYDRPRFETRVVAGVAKATVFLQLSRVREQFSSLSRVADVEGDEGEKDSAARLATQIAKQNVAEQAVSWLYDRRYITRIDEDGHIRRTTKRPGSELFAEPQPKYAKVATSMPTSTSLVLRNEHEPPTGPAALRRPASPPTGPSNRQALHGSNGDTGRLPLNVPTGPSRGSGGNTPRDDSSRSSRAQSIGSGRNYAQACEMLAEVLKLGVPVLYWMPVDPVRAPDTAFNCSAHLKEHTENGTLGGAVAELRNLRVSNGAAEAKEAIAKELYQWLSAKREEKRLQLQEQMKRLGDASLFEI